MPIPWALLLSAAGLGLGGYQAIAGANQPRGAMPQGGEPWGGMPQLYNPTGTSQPQQSPFISQSQGEGMIPSSQSGGLQNYLGMADDLLELYKQYQQYRMAQFSDPSRYTFP